MNLKFSGRGLAFLAHFKADNDIRYYLNGIYLAPMPIEAGGGVLGAATDGHTMGMWHDKDGQIDRPVIARITKPLVAACKKPDAYLTERDGRLVAMAPYKVSGRSVENAPDVELHIQPNERVRPDGGPAWEVEGAFPVITRTVKNNRRNSQTPLPLAEPMFLNCNYLERIGKAMRFSEKFPAVMIQQPTREGAVVVSSPTTPEAFALIMPMHKHGEETEPAWLPRWLAAADRTAAAMAAPAPAMPSDAEPPLDFVKQRTVSPKAAA